MRFLRFIALLVLLLAIVLVWRSTSYQGFAGEVFVDIPHGTSTGEVADLLAKAGVVRTRWDFLAARVLKSEQVLQAGEYRFARPASPFEVYDRIARGDIFYVELVVTEGRNIFDIAAAAEQLGLFPAAQFLAAARNPALIGNLDPQAPTLEGYLFPDTYRLGRHTTPDLLCRIMTGKFREAWRSLSTNADVHNTVTMASLVEKESKLAEDRPRIAAVFENRLRIGMKLDCDPTTIYAALLLDRHPGEPLKIYRSDLESESLYNTYRHTGLPPGPIANPGLASIRAVLNPAGSRALYFVLRPDGSGGHTFSNNIAEHEAATEKYRRGLRR
ncbi:MAG: endolytic transglycosylase MltG [Acidobacteriia bacterium]|nr:endolytic transglycosylase MltG [Terriglobia bacterium]